MRCRGARRRPARRWTMRWPGCRYPGRVLGDRVQLEGNSRAPSLAYVLVLTGSFLAPAIFVIPPRDQTWGVIPKSYAV